MDGDLSQDQIAESLLLRVREGAVLGYSKLPNTDRRLSLKLTLETQKVDIIDLTKSVKHSDLTEEA